MQKETLTEIVNRILTPESGFFLTELTVTADNDITVYIESREGQVVLEDCEKISRQIESELDRETEDYSLTISSAGLDRPFKVIGQYVKHVGQDLEILTVNGEKIKTCRLDAADENGIRISYTALVKEENKKRKVKKEFSVELKYGEIKSAKPVISFK